MCAIKVCLKTQNTYCCHLHTIYTFTSVGFSTNICTVLLLRVQYCCELKRRLPPEHLGALKTTRVSPSLCHFCFISGNNCLVKDSRMLTCNVTAKCPSIRVQFNKTPYGPLVGHCLAIVPSICECRAPYALSV